MRSITPENLGELKDWSIDARKIPSQLIHLRQKNEQGKPNNVHVSPLVSLHEREGRSQNNRNTWKPYYRWICHPNRLRTVLTRESHFVNLDGYLTQTDSEQSWHVKAILEISVEILLLRRNTQNPNFLTENTSDRVWIRSPHRMLLFWRHMRQNLIPPISILRFTNWLSDPDFRWFSASLSKGDSPIFRFPTEKMRCDLKKNVPYTVVKMWQSR